MAISSMPWIKLYTEILDDPKIGRLDKADRWAFVSLCLLAGECDANGYLVNGDAAYSLADIAWRLREPEADIAASMKALGAAGLVTQNEDGVWLVTKFAQRQGRPQSEKRKAWREARRRAHANVQDEESEPDDEDADTETDVESVMHESCRSHAGVMHESCMNHTTREEERREEKSRVEEEESREEKDSAGKFPAHPPDDPISVKKPTPKTKTAVPEAIKVFRQSANRYPARSWYADVVAVVGHDPPDLERWGQVVKEWVGNGWNPTNVRGMLDKFQGKTKDGTSVQENGRKVIMVS